MSRCWFYPSKTRPLTPGTLSICEAHEESTETSSNFFWHFSSLTFPRNPRIRIKLACWFADICQVIYDLYIFVRVLHWVLSLASKFLHVRCRHGMMLRPFRALGTLSRRLAVRGFADLPVPVQRARRVGIGELNLPRANARDALGDEAGFFSMGNWIGSTCLKISKEPSYQEWFGIGLWIFNYTDYIQVFKWWSSIVLVIYIDQMFAFQT